MSESYKVLTRKYRPRSFDDVVSQDHVISTLRNAIAQNRISHAYLFCGPRGVGKTTMARVVARMINGVSMDVDGEELGRTLDIIEIDAASNSGVDDVRSLRDGVRVPPQNGTYKVYIIDEVHMLSKQAFNALLKTLEEPPPYIKFIFATTEPHKVLPTVLSRVQRFDFRRIKISEIVDRLRYICEQESISIDDASLHVIARKADGALRDALSIMDQAIAFCGNTIEHDALLDALNVVSNDRLFEIVDCAANHDARRAMEIIDALLFEGHDIQEFLGALTEHFRNMYLAREAGSIRLVEATDEEKSRLKRAASAFSDQDLLRMMHLVSETQYRIRDAQQPRIQLEIAILKLTTMDRSEGLNQLLSEIRDLKKKLHESGSGAVTTLAADRASAGSNSISAEVTTGNKTTPDGTSAGASAGKASDRNGTAAGTPSNRSSSGKGPIDASLTASSGDAASKTSPATKSSPSAAPSNGSAYTAPAGSASLLTNYLGKTALRKKSPTGGGQTPAASTDDSRPSATADAYATPATTQKSPTEVAAALPTNGVAKPEGPPAPGAPSTRQYESTGEASDRTASAFEEDLPTEGGFDPDDDLIQEDAPLTDRPVALHELREAWPRWMEQIQQDCPQLVYFSMSRTELMDVRDREVHLECQDELTHQMVTTNARRLTTCLEKTLHTTLHIKATIRQRQQKEDHNDPYTQFKKLQQADPKVRMIVDIFGAELEY